MADDESETQIAAEILIRATTAALAQVGGAVSPTVGIAAAMAKEVVDPALVAAASWVERTYRDRAGSLWLIASRESGLEPEVLVERLTTTEASLSLMAETVEAAMRTAVPEKIAALGRVLSNAAHDGTAVDKERLIVAALSQLETPHIRMLDLLACKPPVRVMQGQQVRNEGWTSAEIRQALPGFDEVIDPLMVALGSAGLVLETSVQGRGQPVWEEPAWRATAFGKLCIGLLRDPEQVLNG